MIQCILWRVVTLVRASFFARTDIDVSAPPWFVMASDIVWMAVTKDLVAPKPVVPLM